jgi:hypothetical protein
MDLLLMKASDGRLGPINDEGAELLKKIKPGYVIECRITRKRNSTFHRRFFKLLDVAFDAYEETAPHVEYHGVRVLPNRDRFRKDIIILAGFYEPTFNIKGELRMEPKSISFASMDQDEFEHLYSAVLNVVLTRILSARGYSEESLRAHVDRVLSFDNIGPMP